MCIFIVDMWISGVLLYHALCCSFWLLEEGLDLTVSWKDKVEKYWCALWPEISGDY